MEVTMGRIQLYIIGGIFLFGALTAFYYNWRTSIEREALMEYNQAQLEQNIKDQQALKEKLENIAKRQKEIEDNNSKDKKEFEGKIGDISTNLTKTETIKNDRPASSILKETVKRLQEVPK
jgi:hypothetical protein